MTETPSYEIVGYDKDNDVYETLTTAKYYATGYRKLKLIAQKHKEQEIKSTAGEPFDWFELIYVPTDTRKAFTDGINIIEEK